jgi:hypothetical protein
MCNKKERILQSLNRSSKYYADLSEAVKWLKVWTLKGSNANNKTNVVDVSYYAVVSLSA